MEDELVTFHVIEPGSTGRPTLFEVSMIVELDTRTGLQDCDQESWQHVIGHAKNLVAQHLDRAEIEPA
ncbi:MAG TPA: hypothetical protein VD790_10915 [Thermoleophilaceae bacterium]|nr:hypothetical protein [Thermoleophilaceae bacterium]